MTPIKISEISSVLREDEGVYNNRLQLAGLLGVPTEVVNPADFRLMAGSNGFGDYLNSILKTWVFQEGEKATKNRLMDTLETMKLTSAVEKLQQHVETEHNGVESSSFGIPESTPNFVGREDELSTLLELWKKKSADCVVVSGIGGQGKTELIKTFLQNLRALNEVLITMWFHGHSPSALFNSIRECCSQFGVTGLDRKSETYFTTALQKLNKVVRAGKAKRWLVVVDNADGDDLAELEEVVGGLLRFRGFVIITTTRSNIFTEEATQLKLSPLDINSAKLFVSSLIPGVTEEDNMELCQFVHCHILTLRHAVAYIRKQRAESLEGKSYSVQRFVAEVKVPGTVKAIRLSDYTKTLEGIMRLVMEQLSEVQKYVLMILASMSSYNVPAGLICKMFFALLQQKELQEGKCMQVVDLALRHLKTHSLIEVENRLIAIYPMMQSIVCEIVDVSTLMFNILMHIDKTVIDQDELEQLEIAFVKTLCRLMNSLPETNIFEDIEAVNGVTNQSVPMSAATTRRKLVRIREVLPLWKGEGSTSLVKIDECIRRVSDGDGRKSSTGNLRETLGGFNEIFLDGKKMSTVTCHDFVSPNTPFGKILSTMFSYDESCYSSDPIFGPGYVDDDIRGLLDPIIWLFAYVNGEMHVTLDEAVEKVMWAVGEVEKSVVGPIHLKETLGRISYLPKLVEREPSRRNVSLSFMVPRIMLCFTWPPLWLERKLPGRCVNATAATVKPKHMKPLSDVVVVNCGQEDVAKTFVGPEGDPKE